MNNKLKQSEYEDDGERYIQQLKEKEEEIDELIKTKAPKNKLLKELEEIKEIETEADYIPDAYSGFMGSYTNGMYEKYLKRIKYIKTKLKYNLMKYDLMKYSSKK